MTTRSPDSVPPLGQGSSASNTSNESDVTVVGAEQRDPEETRHYETPSTPAAPPGIPELWGTISLSESTQRFGKYEVIGPIGIGGMGVVVKARDPGLERVVAIKVLGAHLAQNERARKRFLREGRAAAAINHPNVMTIHAVEEDVSGPFLVMEFVAGKTLREVIEERKQLTPAEVITISLQVAKGLAAAHAKGVIHRDVKPANVMMHAEDQRIRLMDFGLAEVKNENIDLTSQDQVVGTPSYMAPEQVRGGEIDARADLFSLGCLIYALLTGQSPFHGRNHSEAVMRVLSNEPAPLSDNAPGVPEELVAIVDRLLAKDVSARFQSANEVVAALQKLTNGELVPVAVSLDVTATGEVPASNSSTTRFVPLSKESASDWKPLLAAVVSLAAVGLLMWQITNTPKSVSQEGSKNANEVAAPAVVLSPHLVVASDGSGDCKSIGEALERIAPQGTITLADAGPFAVSFVLSGPRYNGLTIEARDRAVVRHAPSETPGPMIELADVSNVTMRRLDIEASDSLQSKAVCQVSGASKGITLDGVSFRHESPQGNSSFLDIKGDGDNDIEVQGLACRFMASGGSGCVAVKGSATSLELRNCVLSNRLTVLRIDSEVRHIKLMNNVFLAGQNAINIDIKHWQPQTRIEILNNTFVGCRYWLGLVNSFRKGTPPQGKTDSRVCNNLILGGERTQGNRGDQWPYLVESWQFAANWWERDETTQADAGWDGKIAIMKDRQNIPQRDDAQHPDYLRPATDSELLTSGVGGDLPNYIGARGAQ